VLRGARRPPPRAPSSSSPPTFASDRATVAQALNLREEEAAAALAGVDGVLAIPDPRAPEAWTTAAKWQRLEAAACEAVAAAHRAEPLAPGLEMESLRTQLPWDVPPGSSAGHRAVRRAASRPGGERGARAGHRVALGAAAHALGARVERLLAEVASPSRLAPARGGDGCGAQGARRRARGARGRGEGARIAPDLYTPAPRRRGEGDRRGPLPHAREITATVFRDLIGASRKFAIAFLDWCDRTGVTLRVGDIRKLRR